MQVCWCLLWCRNTHVWWAPLPLVWLIIQLVRIAANSNNLHAATSCNTFSPGTMAVASGASNSASNSANNSGVVVVPRESPPPALVALSLEAGTCHALAAAAVHDAHTRVYCHRTKLVAELALAPTVCVCVILRVCVYVCA